MHFLFNTADGLKTSQGSKIALVRSYLRVLQAAGRVKILIFLVKIKFFPIYAYDFCDAGQVPILRYFETCVTGIFQYYVFFHYYVSVYAINRRNGV